MKKIIVIGCPGSGKSTFSRELHDKTKIPLFHLDMLFWNADKTTVEKSVFLERLNELLDKDEWILDGNFNSTMELRMLRCDTVIFLDYPPDICLEGVRARRGKVRFDMPWIETEEDAEFMDYICPSCGGVLEACQGNHNQYHFKHYRIADCNHGSETALHIMAKNIIAKSKLVYLPNIPIEINNSYSRGRCGQSFNGSVCSYSESYIEKDIPPDLRCDVLLEKLDYTEARRNLFQQYEPERLNVEIKVTHEVDLEKKLKIYNANLETIEIDLSDCVDDFDENKIRNIIISGNKTELIYSPTCRNFYAEKLLGNYDKISYDRSGRMYFEKCMCIDPKERIYLCSDIGGNICSYKKGLREGNFLCMGLYGDLDCNTVDKIIKIEIKNDIVQYAELIVNGEKRVYFNNSSCPYFSEHQKAKNVPQIGMKIIHKSYGELTIIDVDNKSDKTIIRVEYLNGETSQMNWNILCKNNMVKII